MNTAHHQGARRLEAALERSTGRAWRANALASSGFCAVWRIDDGRDSAFLKSAGGAEGALLQAEAQGLRALAATRTVRVPEVLWLHTDAESGLSLLGLEWLDLRPPAAGFGARFGRVMAALHAAAVPVLPGEARYGWPADNWLGATPQCNRPCRDWIDFFNRQRLGALCSRLRQAGSGCAALCDGVDQVIASWPALFDDGYAPQPSLLHGDLWSGNWGMLASGEPVVFDPAVYIGDAEAELAMMDLFGGPPPAFWSAYAAAGRGLHPGYARRRPVYQLYHLLNHALLFGGGYAAQAQSVAQQVLRGLG